MEENIRKLIYYVPKQFEGKTLHDFLNSQGYSEELIKHLKITTNMDMLHILKTNEELKINIIETEKSDIEPNANLKYNILYEDQDMIIINKPADMPIHPSQGNHNNTLGNALAYYYKNKNFVYRPITRLDRDTSGICLVALNRYSASFFAQSIAKNLIKRTYLGLVKGNIYNALKINPNLKSFTNLEHLSTIELIVNIPIKRKNDSTIERITSRDGEQAITKIYALKYIEKYDISLCKFILYTGRTHQIRVHMCHIGFPIIGDFLYNPDYTLIKRQALHSNELLLTHPINRELIRFVAPIQDDMKILIDTL